MKKTLFILIILPILFSCNSNYNKILKSPDIEKRLELGIELYKKNQYLKALPLFESLYRDIFATKKAEEILFYLAYCYYGINDYESASLQFSDFYHKYPNSEYAEESAYLATYCSYISAPPYYLTQENTENAMNKLQAFINEYPYSKYVPKCNEYIDKLRQRLEKKYFEIAKMYLDVADYKAASYSFKTLILEFPNISNKEEIMYYEVISDLQLALNSIEELKEDRTKFAILSYNLFMKKYPQSTYLKKIENLKLKLKNNKI